MINHFPQIKLYVVFENKFPIWKLFRFKNRIDKPYVSMLIYKYELNRCNSIYIDKTSRRLCNRVSEHKGISFHSRLQLTTHHLAQYMRIFIII